MNDTTTWWTATQSKTQSKTQWTTQPRQCNVKTMQRQDNATAITQWMTQRNNEQQHNKRHNERHNQQVRGTDGSAICFVGRRLAFRSRFASLNVTACISSYFVPPCGNASSIYLSNRRIAQTSKQRPTQWTTQWTTAQWMNNGTMNNGTMNNDFGSGYIASH